MPSHTTEETLENDGSLQRGLSNRHIQLIAIGGAIGTGLFMGSGKTIHLTGPSILFVYMIIGAAIFFVLRAMGELLLSNLSYKSFSDFSSDILSPAAGFFVGWSYWFMWVVTAVADVIAITGYCKFWWPNVPLWAPAIVVIGLLLALNLPSVKNFGEIEFWFALIKIVAILALIVVGGIMVATSFTSPSGSTAQVSNLWANEGGWFPHGAIGFLGAFQIALFAFLGAELVGTAAAETQDPETTLPKAINAVPVRIILFYVLTLAVILMVTPWTQIDPAQSPFVSMFSLAGLGIAASIINFVVLTSATSSANSGIFSTSRMVFGLAEEGSAPTMFGKLSKNGVPRNALFLSAVLLLSSIVLLYSGDSVIGAFTLVTTVAAILAIFNWCMIVISYIVYRRKFPERHAHSSYKMPGGVIACYLVLAFFVFMLVVLAFYEDTRAALFAMPVWFIVLAIGWVFVRRHPNHHRLQEKAKLERTAAIQQVPPANKDI
ncbi:MAG: amino acid permease [Rothia sp. (in: high G+C Gram-positive bacteria)]|nr:amino acid permease [Rothia sp. (in: high G+C Gram-positive bacteria)]